MLKFGARCNAAGAFGSMQWLINRYTDRGIKFDEIWGWELERYDPDDFWNNVPMVRPGRLSLPACLPGTTFLWWSVRAVVFI
jgi:hypothetical protein